MMKSFKSGLLFIGSPAVGKTTLANIIISQLEGKLIEQDDFIEKLKPLPNSSVTLDIESQSIRLLMSEIVRLNGLRKFVVGTASLHRIEDLEIIENELPLKLKLVSLHCSLNTVLMRNARRLAQDRVPEDYIRMSAAFFSAELFQSKNITAYNTGLHSPSALAKKIVHDE